MRTHVLFVVVLAACGGAPAARATPAAPTTSLRPVTEAESSALRAALAALPESDAELLHAEAAGTPSRVLALYAHADAPTVAAARDRACGATGESEPAPLADAACRHLAIGRLSADGTTLDARYELGAWCSDDTGTFELFAADFDRDGRDEVSVMVGERAAFVFDVETFGVQFVGEGIDYALQWPDGTGLVRPVPRDRDAEESSGYAPYEFEDDLAHPEGTIYFGCEGEPMRRRRHDPDRSDEPLELVPYDAAADCWRTP